MSDMQSIPSIRDYQTNIYGVPVDTDVKMSSDIGKLAEALSAFQGEVQDPMKDKSFQIMGKNVEYADIETVLKAVRPLLVKNGLAVTQLLGSMLDRVTITTILMHKSGQYISSKAVMRSEGPKISKQGNQITSDAQASGSVISYLRRYALCGLLGLAQADNDAQVGNGGRGQQREAPVKDFTIHNEINALIKKHNIEINVFMGWWQHYKVKGLTELTVAQAAHLLKGVKEKYEGATE